MWLKKITRRIMSVYVLVEYYIKLPLNFCLFLIVQLIIARSLLFKTTSL